LTLEGTARSESGFNPELAFTSALAARLARPTPPTRAEDERLPRGGKVGAKKRADLPKAGAVLGLEGKVPRRWIELVLSDSKSTRHNDLLWFRTQVFF
jgi:hypothetical protein